MIFFSTIVKLVIKMIRYVNFSGTEEQIRALSLSTGAGDCHVPLSCKISALGSKCASNMHFAEETNATQLSHLHIAQV